MAYSKLIKMRIYIKDLSLGDFIICDGEVSFLIKEICWLGESPTVFYYLFEKNKISPRQFSRSTGEFVFLNQGILFHANNK